MPGELANAALDALTAPEQHQAESILQHGEDAAAAETMARPAPVGIGLALVPRYWRWQLAQPTRDLVLRQACGPAGVRPTGRRTAA